jgi:hypothetical protein
MTEFWVIVGCGYGILAIIGLGLAALVFLAQVIMLVLLEKEPQ